MARYSATVRDQNANPIVGVKVYVVTREGATPTLTDDNGNTLAQPLVTDAYGTFYFNAPVEFYDLSYYYGGRLVQRDFSVPVGGPVTSFDVTLEMTELRDEAIAAAEEAEESAEVALDAMTQIAQLQALAATLAADQPFPNAYASTLPKGVTSTSITNAGTGYTPNTYALGVSGGPAGFAGTYTVGGGGTVTNITITNPGLSTAATAPTLSFPSGGGTGATATATVSSIIPVERSYAAASSDSSASLVFKNDGTATPAPVNNPDGSQISLPQANGVPTLIAAVYLHFVPKPSLGSPLLRAGTPYFFPTFTPPANFLLYELGRDSVSGGRFRATYAEYTAPSTYTPRLGVAASGSHIVPTGLTGWRYIPIKTIDNTYPGFPNGTTVGYHPFYFGTGENFGTIGAFYTFAQAQLDVTYITTDTIFDAKSANIASDAFALVRQYFRSWANNTVTDQNLLGLVDDAVVEQGTPGRDYVIRYEKIAFPGIPLWRTRWFLYDPVLARDVAFWAYSSPSDPSATLESLYRPIFLADAALGSPIGPNYDAVVVKLGIESWANAPWTIALTTTTDPAVAGVKRGQVIDGQTMQDRFRLGSEPKRTLTYGNIDADYETLNDLVVGIRDPAIGSYTYSDWPTSFLSYSHQIEAVCIEPGYVEDLHDIVIPRWLTITGIWDTLLEGITTRTFEQSFASRIRRNRLRIETEDEYLGHIDNSNGVSEISADGILRHFETYMIEDCVIEVGPDQDRSVFGCGMENNAILRFDRCIFDVDPGNTSAYPIILIHSNPLVTRPGRLEIEDCTFLKRNRTGPAVFLQSLQEQAQRNVVVVKTSDVPEIVHEYGSGVSTPAWQIRGKTSATTYSPELMPA